jgi:hypothetical protein
MSNPTLELIDIASVSRLAHAVGATVVVDNVFATPVFSDAIGLGADVVIYSATKHIDGQGRCLGGVILGTTEMIRKTVEPYMKHTGGAMSPFNAWVMLKSLEHVELRCRAQAESAQAIAEALEGHAALSRVIFPGLASHPQHALAQAQMTRPGTMLALELKGGQAAAFRFLNALELITISNNLGDAKSIITHPATTTHQRLSEEARAALGITPGLVRLSVGLEDAGDLIADLTAGAGGGRMKGPSDPALPRRGCRASGARVPPGGAAFHRGALFAGPAHGLVAACGRRRGLARAAERDRNRGGGASRSGPVGFMALNAAESFVDFAYVDPSVRGQGVARRFTRWSRGGRGPWAWPFADRGQPRGGAVLPRPRLGRAAPAGGQAALRRPAQRADGKGFRARGGGAA